jgi:hypothetical protein
LTFACASIPSNILGWLGVGGNDLFLLDRDNDKDVIDDFEDDNGEDDEEGSDEVIDDDDENDESNETQSLESSTSSFICP